MADMKPSSTGFGRLPADMTLAGAILAAACAGAPSAADRVDVALSPYETAFQYLRDSPEIAKYCREQVGAARCPLLVADSTVLLGDAFFAPAVSRLYGRDLRSVSDSIMRADSEHARTFMSVPLPATLQTRDANGEGLLGVFFDTVKPGTLSAAVLGWYKPGQIFRDAARFKPGLMFLFFFRDNGTIERVLTIALQFE